MPLNKIRFHSAALRAGVASFALAGALITSPLSAEEAGGALGDTSDYAVRQVQFTSENSQSTTLDEYVREQEEASGKSSGGFTQSLKNAGKSIQNAFMVKSKTTAPDDPLSLANTPDRLDAGIYLSTGRILEQQGKFDDASKQYAKALEENPDSLLALISYGRLLERQGKSTAALEYYQRAAEAHPDNAIAMNDLGLCYLKLKRVDDALAAIFKATTIEPENKRYRNNMASALVEGNRLEEAYSQLEYAHGPAAGHYNLGYLLYKKGDIQLARTHVSLALEKDPNLAAARQLLAILDQSQPAVAGRPVYGQQPNLRRLPAAPSPPQLNFNQDSVGAAPNYPQMRR